MSYLYRIIIKRMFDIVFSLSLLIVTAIPMLIIFIAIKVSSRGAVIFSQVRFGLDSQPFRIYKFRTMRQNTPIVANQGFSDINQYVTKIGAFLRSTSLDELPQLVNVLKGEMSFIGPRPLADTDLEVIKARRLSGADQVRPGITGLAQVHGRNLVGNEDKAKYDAAYAQNISLINDIKIIWMTVVSVLKKTGINSNDANEGER